MYVARRCLLSTSFQSGSNPSSLISIPVLVRIRVTQCREFEGEHIAPVGQSQGLGIRDGFLEHRVGADRNRFVEDLKLVITTGGT